MQNAKRNMIGASVLHSQRFVWVGGLFRLPVRAASPTPAAAGKARRSWAGNRSDIFQYAKKGAAGAPGERAAHSSDFHSF